MKTYKAKKILAESIIWLLMAIPVVYFLLVYNQLPQQIPIHFNIHGQPDNWTSKASFIFYLLGMTLGVYLVIVLVPLIDPKKRILQMGRKFYALKLILMAFMSGLALVIIISAKNQQIVSSRFIWLFVAVLLIVLGNYMPSVKPNYFIGVRTPWTLESEQNWRATHRFTGWLWTLDGFFMLILGLLVKSAKFYATISFINVLLVAFLPVLYSFLLFLKTQKSNT